MFVCFGHRKLHKTELSLYLFSSRRSEFTPYLDLKEIDEKGERETKDGSRRHRESLMVSLVLLTTFVTVTGRDLGRYPSTTNPMTRSLLQPWEMSVVGYVHWSQTRHTSRPDPLRVDTHTRTTTKSIIVRSLRRPTFILLKLFTSPRTQWSLPPTSPEPPVTKYTYRTVPSTHRQSSNWFTFFYYGEMKKGGDMLWGVP